MNPPRREDAFILIFVCVYFWGFRTVTVYFAEPYRRGVGPVDGPLVFIVWVRLPIDIAEGLAFRTYSAILTKSSHLRAIGKHSSAKTFAIFFGRRPHPMAYLTCKGVLP